MSTVALQLTERPLPPVTGSIGITQGVYGDRGNLELVAPDPKDGFWVFWFNGDALEHRRGAARGHWNAGLHVPTGSRLLSARISQVPFGPNFLEVVGRVESAGVQRWYWTPDDGFLPGGTVGSSAGGELAPIVASGDRLTTMRVDDAGIEVLTSDVEHYPALSWQSSRVPVDGIAAAVNLDVSLGVSLGLSLGLSRGVSPGFSRGVSLGISRGVSSEISLGAAGGVVPDGDAVAAVEPNSGQSTAALGLVVVGNRAHLLRSVGTTGWQLGTPLPGEWRTAHIHVLDRASAVLTGLDMDGRLVLADVDLARAGDSTKHCSSSSSDVSHNVFPDVSFSGCLTYSTGPADDIAACLSTLPANLAAPEPACTLEVLLRTGAELRHLRFDARSLRPYRASAGSVRARVWH